MSDYVHKKVIRLPFPKGILEKCNTTDPYDCEEYLENILGKDLYSHNKDNYYFEITYTDKENYYLDWVYYDTYGKSSGDFGSARYLTEKEFKIIKPLFDKLGIVYKKDDLRRVEYSYYNCCEPSDYYDISDDSEILIDKK